MMLEIVLDLFMLLRRICDHNLTWRKTRQALSTFTCLSTLTFIQQHQTRKGEYKLFMGYPYPGFTLSRVSRDSHTLIFLDLAR